MLNLKYGRKFAFNRHHQRILRTYIGMHNVKVDREKVSRIFIDFGTLFLFYMFCKPV